MHDEGTGSYGHAKERRARLTDPLGEPGDHRTARQRTNRVRHRQQTEVRSRRGEGTLGETRNGRDRDPDTQVQRARRRPQPRKADSPAT